MDRARSRLLFSDSHSSTNTNPYDAIIVGAGVSGSWIADELTRAGKRCLVLEAGKHFPRGKYPQVEMDANSQLYWSGGIEFNATADIGFLRPKVVGGGSIVNQALVDRFEDLAWEDWARDSGGIEFFEKSKIAPHYDAVEERITIQTIPAEFRNGNAKIFEEGFQKNGYKCAPLRRAQKDCQFEKGTDCIECLAGCKLESKQSTPWTVLKRAEETGRLDLVAEFEVQRVSESSDGIEVEGITAGGARRTFRGAKLVLASGAIGNSKLLLLSGWGSRLPALGTHFYTHPQFMNLALYDRPVNSHKGPFQAFKSDDPNFRRAGFKLENVFAPPVAVSMLIPGVGSVHQELMREIIRFGCVEVAVRDVNPGRIRLSGRKAVIDKSLGAEDQKRRLAGQNAVEKIFRSTGAKRFFPGAIGIGLHLMGGCRMGKDFKTSVVGPDFRVHGSKRVFAADSSIFPNAPGINPSMTIMALSLRGAQEILSS
jgi:choline dehydrogenase-like flavoprotein